VAFHLYSTALFRRPLDFEEFVGTANKNLDNSCVHSYTILAECQFDRSILSSYHLPDRLFVQFIDHRPSFGEILDAINMQPHALACILNSDIQLVSLSDVIELVNVMVDSPRPLMATVTRSDDHEHDKLISVANSLPEFLSSDCWIFNQKPEVSDIFKMRLGDMNLENQVNYLFRIQGFSVFNACGHLQAIHLDQKGSDEYVLHSETDTIRRLAFQSQRPTPIIDYSVAPRYLEFFNILSSTGVDIDSCVQWHSCSQRHILFHASDISSLHVEVFLILSIANYFNRFCWIYLPEDCDETTITALRFLCTVCNNGYILDSGYRPAPLFDDSGCPAADAYVIKGIWGLSPEVLKSKFPITILSSAILTFNPELGSSSVFFKGFQDRLAFLRSNPFLTDEMKQVLDDIDQKLQAIDSRWNNVQILSCTYSSEAFLPRHFHCMNSVLAADAGAMLWLIMTKSSKHEITRCFNYLNNSEYGSKCAILLLREDKGLYACWNSAIKLSNSHFITNANPDDMRSPNHTVKLKTALVNSSGKSLVASSIVAAGSVSPQQWDEVDSLLKKESLEIYFEEIESSYEHRHLFFSDNKGHVKAYNIPHCSPLWDRQVHRLYGFFDEHRYGSEADWALWLNYAKHGGSFVHVPEILSFYYVNPDSYGRMNVVADGRLEIVSSLLLRPQASNNHQSVIESIKTTLLSSHSREQHTLDIVGFDNYYGSHRHSNNSILEALYPIHSSDSPTKFYWFLEHRFLWGKDYSAEYKQTPIQTPWIGCLHVPPTTPGWAGNQFSLIHYTESWQESLKFCRALITLSSYMADQVRLFYPDIPLFSIKHPMLPLGHQFRLDLFCNNPRLVLAGAWLRNTRSFYSLKTDFTKIHILKDYSKSQMNKEWTACGHPVVSGDVQQVNFLSSEDYDRLLTTSLIYLDLYDVSASNAICECIVSSTPFVCRRHPAIIEYVGNDYPLLFDHESDLEHLITIENVKSAHCYLVDNPQLANNLSHDKFLTQIKRVLMATI
jgi:hypothetical protein